MKNAQRLMKHSLSVSRRCYSKEVNTLSVYVHWPFCKDICPYCDFNRYKRDKIDHKSMKESYTRIIDNFFTQNPEFKSRTLSSIFFGGGTPSTAEPETFYSIINHINLHINCDQAEITMEANPTSIESEKLQSFKNAGINRVSIGVQSLHEQDLQFLGRKHSVDEAVSAIQKAKSIFDNVSLDLMFGTALHARDPSIWEDTLKVREFLRLITKKKALALDTDHISLYQLTIEKNTKFYNKHKSGDFILPSESVYEDLYDTAIRMCKEKGLDQYEVSNFAKRGRESQHNLQYWKCRDYVGIGPGAHSRLTFDKHRKGFVQIMQPEQWMEIVSRNEPTTLLGTIKEEQLSPEDRYDELFLMGLRLTQRGVSEKALLHHTGKNFEALNRNILKQLLSSGHLDWRITSDDRFLMATEKGIKVLDALLATLLK